jgi:hypothetical protein
VGPGAGGCAGPGEDFGTVSGGGGGGHWWIEYAFAMREGKPYKGLIGTDVSGLGFWTAAVLQAHLSVICLS